MNARWNQLLLTAVIGLLTAILVRDVVRLPAANAEEPDGTRQVPSVLQAQAIELVNERGQVVAQLYAGEDGGGNLRLRGGDGTVRVKLGATDDGSALLLFDKEVEQSVEVRANKSGTSVTLAEKGKERHVIRP